MVPNDEMAELITRYPDRLAAARAKFAMNDIDAALKEADKAIIDVARKLMRLP